MGFPGNMVVFSISSTNVNAAISSWDSLNVKPDLL